MECHNCIMCDAVIMVNVQVDASDTTVQQAGEGATRQATEEAGRITSPPQLTEHDIEQTLNSMPDVSTGQTTPASKFGF